ncbi:MAG: TetR/AcrR family transcriptional regulator [Sulfurospirillaceae bacterium]|nr:TetR/AcrR family transcriptional regulator [Sulfurospirillaceae bacterium]
MKKTTRQKLIDATFEEVYSHGYQGAALSDILTKAGVHKGSMYHYFGSKKDMALTALKEKIYAKFLERYGKILELQSGYLEQFIKGIEDTELRDLRRGCPIANIIQEMSNLDDDFHQTMKAIYAEFREYIKKILDKAIEKGEMKHCDTQKLALFITATLEGAILSTKASGEIDDYENVVEILISHIWQYKI